MVFAYFFQGRTRFTARPVVNLEIWIDKLSEQLPPLKNFILPVSLYNCFSQETLHHRAFSKCHDFRFEF